MVARRVARRASRLLAGPRALCFQGSDRIGEVSRRADASAREGVAALAGERGGRSRTGTGHRAAGQPRSGPAGDVRCQGAGGGTGAGSGRGRRIRARARELRAGPRPGASLGHARARGAFSGRPAGREQTLKVVRK